MSPVTEENDSGNTDDIEQSDTTKKEGNGQETQSTTFKVYGKHLAMLGAIFLIFGILMSGFFYPIANMPSWAQVLTYANPMRYIMAIVRGILLKGAGAADLWPQIAALAGIGVVVFTGAVRSFAKRVG